MKEFFRNSPRLSTGRNCGAVSTHRCKEAEDTFKLTLLLHARQNIMKDFFQNSPRYNPPPGLLIGNDCFKKRGYIFASLDFLGVELISGREDSFTL